MPINAFLSKQYPLCFPRVSPSAAIHVSSESAQSDYPTTTLTARAFKSKEIMNSRRRSLSNINVVQNCFRRRPLWPLIKIKIKQGMKSFLLQRADQESFFFYVVCADEGPEAVACTASFCLTFFIHQSGFLPKNLKDLPILIHIYFLSLGGQNVKTQAQMKEGEFPWHFIFQTDHEAMGYYYNVQRKEGSTDKAQIMQREWLSSLINAWIQRFSSCWMFIDVHPRHRCRRQKLCYLSATLTLGNQIGETQLEAQYLHELAHSVPRAARRVSVCQCAYNRPAYMTNRPESSRIFVKIVIVIKKLIY